MRYLFTVLWWCAALILGTASGVHAQSSAYDLVLQGGRVIDPETGLDGIRDVAMNAGRIVGISESPLQGETRIDVSSLVVAPGFIDLHTHSPTPLGQHYQVLDGVTTALAAAAKLKEGGRRAMVALDHVKSKEKLTKSLELLRGSFVRFYDPQLLAQVRLQLGVVALQTARPDLVARTSTTRRSSSEVVRST